MRKYLDTIIACVVFVLVIVAEYHAVFDGAFEPMQLSGGIALLLLVRVIHHHAPRFIASKYKSRQ